MRIFVACCNDPLPTRANQAKCLLRWAFRTRNWMKNLPVAARETRDWIDFRTTRPPWTKHAAMRKLESCPSGFCARSGGFSTLFPFFVALQESGS